MAATQFVLAAWLDANGPMCLKFMLRVLFHPGIVGFLA